MIGNLYTKTLYTINSDFVITNIYEYDIAKANISILVSLGYITEDDYRKYYSMDKKEREIKIGYIQKNNPQIKAALEDGFMRARRMLIVENSIEDEEIIAIKKDALYVTRPLMITKFGYIEFTLRNRYSLMLKTSNPRLEFYFGISDVDGVPILDVKGIKDEALPLHEGYMLSFLCDLFKMIAKGEYEEAISELAKFMKGYSNRSLPIGFYREFNSTSHFRIFPGFYSEFSIDRADESIRGSINISDNFNLLTEIMKLLSEMYLVFNK